VGDAERDVWVGPDLGEWEAQTLPGQLSLFDLEVDHEPARPAGKG